ncbi:MAG: zinc-binding dehydrogenase [Mycobacterium sp.]|nr:zinc-binding dehydrogenase [Mycobacterium sp.]
MCDGAVARALVLESPRHLVVREFPVPMLGDDDALVRVAACALCGTDHEQYTGELAGGFAFVPGHETVGTIAADVVVDVTAKAPAAFAQTIALARPAGTVVVAGTRGLGIDAPGFSPDMVVFKELRILGALGVDVTAYRAAVELLASGRYPFESLPRRCAGLDEADDLLAVMAGERDGAAPVHGVITP